MPALPVSLEAIGVSIQMCAIYFSWRFMARCRPGSIPHHLGLLVLCFNAIMVMYGVLELLR